MESEIFDAIISAPWPCEDQPPRRDVEEITGVRLKRWRCTSMIRGASVGGNIGQHAHPRAIDWEPGTPLAVGLEKTYLLIYEGMGTGARLRHQAVACGWMPQRASDAVRSR